MPGGLRLENANKQRQRAHPAILDRPDALWFFSALLPLGSAALVVAFFDLLDDFGDEGVQIIGAARRDDALIGHNLFVLPVGAGIFQVGFDRPI
ncbi:hypothetical protein D3C80_1783370 [compost metagenome]